MKTVNIFSAVIGALLLHGTALDAQVNKSSKESYKERIGNKEPKYSTNYDNGYVTLRDGTTLSGEISLLGNSYEDVNFIKIRTSGGEKYFFSPRSLKEYGLSNNLVNDTPDLFYWVTENKKSAFTGFQDVRTGSCSFGYVNTKEGKKYEGSISIKEANGKIEHITVKDDTKKSTKLDADKITNFGVTRYVDKKFMGVWSLVPWRTPKFSGILVNIKSEPIKGVLTTNDGQVLKGFITLFKKDEIITQIEVRADPKAKPEKFKYPDVKSYTMEQRIEDYNDILKSDEDLPFEQVHPSRKFYPGKILLVDGTLHEGLVAKAVDSDYSDIYFAKDETAFVEGFAASDVEGSSQNIPEQIMKDYKKLIYDRDHIKGYTVQRPPQWVYKEKLQSGSKFGGITDNSGSETEFQPGYLILADGTQKVGALSVLKINNIERYTIKEGEKSEKYFIKDVKDYGLIETEASTVFPANWFTHYVFSKKKNGFIVLTGSNKFIRGPLEIKSKTDEKTSNVTTEFVVNGEKYNLANIDLYGLMDMPASDLMGAGVLTYNDPKQNFNPGSFVVDGNKKEGWIAWYKPNDVGEFDAFFYSEKQDGIANVYYTSRGASNVIQNVAEEIKEYNPLEDSYLATKTIDKEVKNNGYVITTSGEKIEGAVQLSFPPKLWFATDVILTKADGTISNYTNDGSLKKVVVIIDGVEKEFVNYENEYVEVLQHDGNLVHFRNPHPTTQTFVGAMANQVVGEALNELDREVRTYAYMKGMNPDAVGLTKNGQRVDFTNEENMKLYEKEFMIMDETTGRHTMYVPHRIFYQMDFELMGCIEYLTMEKEGKAGLKKVQNPLQTMKFLNENMNN